MPRISRQPPSGPDGPLFAAAPPQSQATPGSNVPDVGVSELSARVRDLVQGAFSRVRVRGEIGECKRHASGHIYLSLKEGNDVLAAVCWRGQAGRLGIAPATGMDVVCTGKLTTYGGQSKYQLVVEQMELAGAGALLKMLEERKARLAAEGLFRAERKKPLPFLPELVGVVTSPTGAVIRDILHRLADRFPRSVLLWPVAVQGPGAAEQIAAAIRGFNAVPEGGAVPRPDVLIVARGGGSLDDLMAFNEEIVVRAAAESRIPLISAVGHETDVTLIDFAADQRAPTPTAAAEMAVPVRADLVATVRDRAARLDQGGLRVVRRLHEQLEHRARRLGDPLRALEPLMQRFDDRAERLTRALPAYVARVRMRFDRAGTVLPHLFGNQLKTARLRFEKTGARMRHPRDSLQAIARRLDGPAAKLEALSPRAVMKRGYALIYDASGQVVKQAAQMKRGDHVRIELQDAARHAAIED